MFNKQEQKVAEELSNSSNIIGKGTILEGNLETFVFATLEDRIVFVVLRHFIFLFVVCDNHIIPQGSIFVKPSSDFFRF